jgi:uncharacterized protein YndB with AHSA1/START domain
VAAVEPIGPYLEPVRKSITVACDQAHAFEVFTGRLAAWWPIRTHSLSTDRAVSCGIDPRVGGDVFELRDDGLRILWGTVLVWEPPARLVMTWYPGAEPSQAQEVEVRFTSVDSGTRVDLEHRGWEALGTAAAAARAGYDAGWESIFTQLFAAACGVPGRDRS